MLCRSTNVSELYNWQKNRIISVANLEGPATFIITRMRPKKEEESNEDRFTGYSKD